MSVSQKYLRDENGNIFSPIINVDSIYNGGGTLFDSIYPVGSIYLSTSSADPSTLFGGTWERIAQGRTLMGEGVVQDNTDNWCGKTSKGDWTAYAGNMGGETYHQLTIEEMPSHTHKANFSMGGLGNAEGRLVLGNNTQNGTTSGNYGSPVVATGGNALHNNMPPYLVVYIWERIS